MQYNFIARNSPAYFLFSLAIHVETVVFRKLFSFAVRPRLRHFTLVTSSWVYITFDTSDFTMLALNNT